MPEAGCSTDHWLSNIADAVLRPGLHAAVWANSKGSDDFGLTTFNPVLPP